MPELPDLTAVTKLLADESRVALLSLLLSGRFQTVHELAHAVKITDQTASYHLKRMQALEWVSSYKQEDLFTITWPANSLQPFWRTF
nr:winged helix-turn-helix domain-containing protein [Liquorilactobacillus satsumensis]